MIFIMHLNLNDVRYIFSSFETIASCYICNIHFAREFDTTAARSPFFSFSFLGIHFIEQCEPSNIF